MRGGPSIKNIEDVPQEEMVRFRFKDGRTASIWERWIELNPRYLAFQNVWDPGALSAQHGHHGDHINYILKGEIRSAQGDVCGPGTHIMLEYGDVFGPWVAGPEGCTLYGYVGGGDASSFAGDLDLWQRWLDQHEAEQVPVPMPKRLPPWWRDKLLRKRIVNWIE